MVSLQQLGSPETWRPLYDDENTPLKALFQLIQLSQMHQNIHKSLENDIYQLEIIPSFRFFKIGPRIQFLMGIKYLWCAVFP